MYGCFLTDPKDEGADLGVLFFHNAGYSTACGHGTIALATAAIETGMIAGTRATLTLDVPSGRLPVVATVKDGKVERSFCSVPSFVFEQGLEVETSRGGFAPTSRSAARSTRLSGRSVGLKVEPANVTEFIALGREIKAAIETARDVVHPLEPELRDICSVYIFVQGRRNITGLRRWRGRPLAVRERDIGTAGAARPRGDPAAGRDVRARERDRDGVRGARHRRRSGGSLSAVVTEIAGSAHLRLPPVRAPAERSARHRLLLR